MTDYSIRVQHKEIDVPITNSLQVNDALLAGNYSKMCTGISNCNYSHERKCRLKIRFKITAQFCYINLRVNFLKSKYKNFNN